MNEIKKMSMEELNYPTLALVGYIILLISELQAFGFVLFMMMMLLVTPNLFSPLARIRFRPVIVGLTTRCTGVLMESSLNTAFHG